MSCSLKRPNAFKNGLLSPTFPLPTNLEAASRSPPSAPSPTNFSYSTVPVFYAWHVEVRGECPLYKFRGECLLLLRLNVFVWPGLLWVGDKHQVDNSLRRIKPYYSSECLGAPCSHSPLKLAPIPFPTKEIMQQAKKIPLPPLKFFLFQDHPVYPNL